jgi:hypothetical protein
VSTIDRIAIRAFAVERATVISGSSENPQKSVWRVTRFSLPLRGSRTEWPVLQIPSTVQIVRDSSDLPLAIRTVCSLFDTKYYPSFYPDAAIRY